MDERDPRECDDAENAPGEDVPLCTGCGRPVEGAPYYCPHCGTAVNNLTPYIPYVDIAFNYRPFGNVWKELTGSAKVGWWRRVVCAFIVLTCAPLLLVGLPFIIAEWIRNRRDKGKRRVL